MFVFLIEDIFHKILKNYVNGIWVALKRADSEVNFNVARSFNEVQFEKLI